MPDDSGASALLNQHPWLLLLVGGVVVFKMIGQFLAEGSEAWAKAFGPFGKRWRKRRQDKEAAAALAALSAKSEEESWRIREAADIKDLRRQVDNLSGEVKTLRRRDRERAQREDERDDYLIYDAGWHADLEVYAARKQIELPPPPHETFTEWKANHALAQPGGPPDRSEPDRQGND